MIDQGRLWALTITGMIDQAGSTRRVRCDPCYLPTRFPPEISSLTQP